MTFQERQLAGLEVSVPSLCQESLGLLSVCRQLVVMSIQSSATGRLQYLSKLANLEQAKDALGGSPGGLL